jgi:hypothetical protein
MGTVGRIAITASSALLLGAYSYYYAFDHHGDGTLATIAYSTPVALAGLLLPAVAAALVNRWWAPVVALAPFAVEFHLHEMTGYSYPYHEDPYPALAVMGMFVSLAIGMVGFVARFGFERIRETLLTSQPRA